MDDVFRCAAALQDYGIRPGYKWEASTARRALNRLLRTATAVRWRRRWRRRDVGCVQPIDRVWPAARRALPRW